MDDRLDWPANPFWDYALELYRQAGVEGACLDLQRRHGLDINLVLFCCWLGVRGIEVEDDWLARVAAVGGGWQSEVVRPLRAVRDRLKARLAAPPTGSIPARWPELTAGLRQRALAVEIDGERLEQLLLAELLADLPRAAVPGVGLASRNLGHYRRFTREDRRALEIVLAAAFPDAAHEDLAAACEGLAP